MRVQRPILSKNLFHTKPIRHLTDPGAYLWKTTSVQHITAHENKGNVSAPPDYCITEAFGHGKWAKALSYLESNDSETQKGALRALITMLQNPTDAAMCLQQGLLGFVELGILNSVDNELQALSAHLFRVLTETNCGRLQVLMEHEALNESGSSTDSSTDMISRLHPVFESLIFTQDELKKSTRCYICDAFINLSKNCMGAQLFTKRGYLSAVVSYLQHANKVFPTDLHIRIRVLQLLKNIVNDGMDITVSQAIKFGAFEQCCELLEHASIHVRAAACEAVAALSHTDRAKQIAVSLDITKRLVYLLTSADLRIKAAATSALMSLVINDEAKDQFVRCNGLLVIPQLLKSANLFIRWHTLKLTAVVAGYPIARTRLRELMVEESIEATIINGDPKLHKDAKIALEVLRVQ